MAKLTRRTFLLGGGAALVGIGGAAFMLRKKIIRRLSARTRLASFAATPPLIPHDPATERRTLQVAQGGTPAANVDAVLGKLGGIEKIVGRDDVVLIKVSAQWWNQGMTNVAAVKRTIEHILQIPGFTGEVVVFENVHFQLEGGSGLARAWTHPSERNVDVEGWTKLGDLIPHFEKLGAPVGFVGLVDGGASALHDDHWHDEGHAHGKYGGDGRGPIKPGEDRDGYFWDFGNTFRLKRSWVDYAQTPLTWPRFTAPKSGLVVDLKDGLFRRDGGKLTKVDRAVKWINMTTCNEHGSTGFTGACKSAMGVVDMSAGALGTHPRTRDYQSIHYFGSPTASWRMGGPLAFFANKVRKPDLYLTVAEWVAVQPDGPWDEAADGDLRHAAKGAVQKKTIVAGTDPVAIDTWCVKNLVFPHASANKQMLDLADDSSRVVKFLRYFRQVAGSGTMDLDLIDIA